MTHSQADAQVTLQPRICPICSNTFDPIRLSHIYDSNACRQQGYRENRLGAPKRVYVFTCEECGKIKHRYHMRQIYCDGACRQKAFEKRRKLLNDSTK